MTLTADAWGSNVYTGLTKRAGYLLEKIEDIRSCQSEVKASKSDKWLRNYGHLKIEEAQTPTHCHTGAYSGKFWQPWSIVLIFLQFGFDTFPSCVSILPRGLYQYSCMYQYPCYMPAKVLIAVATKMWLKSISLSASWSSFALLLPSHATSALPMHSSSFWRLFGVQRKISV